MASAAALNNISLDREADSALNNRKWSELFEVGNDFRFGRALGADHPSIVAQTLVIRQGGRVVLGPNKLSQSLPFGVQELSDVAHDSEVFLSPRKDEGSVP